jgi:hypothetical protein
MCRLWPKNADLQLLANHVARCSWPVPQVASQSQPQKQQGNLCRPNSPGLNTRQPDVWVEWRGEQPRV